MPLLQYASGAFGVLQFYGVITQYQYRFLLSAFVAKVFTNSRAESDTLLELSMESSFTLLYIIAILFYIRQLKSHFYIPPIYPCRVEYFYYPQDTSNVTVFHKQVPFKIMENYQNSAYIVQERGNGEGKARSSKWRLNGIMNGGVRKYRIPSPS